MDQDPQELVRRIAAVVAHELRNPLAVINNSAYFVKAKLDGAADPKVAKHLEIIESEVARADRLIADILAYARKAEPMMETGDLDALIREAIRSYEPPSGVKLEFKPGAKDVRVKCDPRMLADALHRLLDNAAAAQGGKGKVAIATGASKDGAFVAVSDSGPGVDAKVRGALFEPFVTAKPRGLGLGLALARKLLEANGGTAVYESGPKGATFKLALPRA
ncbi:MAG: HAMP domain-containing histidine kinase [Elusimicrobia bacterium]|nr:HAMP domain-containing histidine kinase [Elusimicrobiota bacterium]